MMRPRRVLVFLLLLLCFTARPLAARGEEGGIGVPDSEAIEKATTLVRRTFAEDYAAARTPAQRAALASRLFKEARQTKDNAPARYVLLCEARDLASRAGEAEVACRAVELLAKHYGVSPGEMTLAALSEAARGAVTTAAQESLARCAMSAADGAILRDEYDLAGRMAAVAQAAAERVKRIALMDEAREKAKEVAWAAEEHSRAKSAIDTLTIKPDDRDAKSAAGRFRCLVKGDWERGLPMLLDGSDATYQALAAADLAAANADPAAQAKAGDQWWDHGQTLPARAGACCRARAAHWYRLCVGKLTGFNRSLIESRLEEIDQAHMRDLHLAPGLVAEVFEGESFAKLLVKRVDPRLEFEWNAAPGDEPVLPRDNFSVRWSGQLRVPQSGEYTLVLIANKGARVFIDDRVVLEEPDGTRKRKGTRQTIGLTEGMHPIRVEFWDAGGLARIRLQWITPGATSEQSVPAQAFFHEIGAER